MKKVKVSKEVAETFGYALDIYEKREKSIADFMYWIKECMNERECTVGEWLKQHNLTDDDLINAYKYGWEVEYDFQVGDFVKINSSVNIAYEITDVNHNTVHVLERGGWYDKSSVMLVCKKGDREDLK